MKDFIDVRVIINDAIIDKNEISKIIEPLWWNVSIYDGEEVYNHDVKKFSKQQKYVFAIEWYNSEVCNGGHDQFYSNSTGIVWEDALSGCKEIGLTENYELLKESANRLGGFPSKDRNMRNIQLEKNEKGFEDLDTKYYKINDLENRLMDYIKKNREYFYFDGIIKKPKKMMR